VADVPLEIIDVQPRRIRRSLDAVRAVSLLVTVLVLGGLGTIGQDTNRGANDDVKRLLAEVPHIFIRLFSAVGATGALAVPLAFVGRELVRGQSRRLIEALITGLLALGAVEGLDRLVNLADDSALHQALARSVTGGDIRPLDAYLAALFAFVVVVGVSGDPRWRGLLVAVTALYVVTAFTATQASLLSLILSPTIGATIGMSVRWLAGSVNDAPDAAAIAAELRRRGVDLVRMERVRAHLGDHRTYLCRTAQGGEAIVQAFDRDLIVTGAVYNVYRLIRLRSEIASAPSLSLDRITEHRTLLALAAAQAGAPVPELLAGVSCGPDTVVLAYDRPASSPLGDLTDGQLRELWTSVELLHGRRITHHGLIAERIRIDSGGHVLLPILSEGSVFASDLRVSVDRVQLLVTTGALVGAARAVRGARSVLSESDLIATLPMLQPVALTREARAIASHDKRLINSIRDEIQQPTAERLPELANLERVRPRTVVAVLALLVAGYLLVAQFGSVDLVAVFRHARWKWLPLVALASAATYVAAAVSLTGYVQEKLNFPRTVLAQLAASFVGFVTPPAVGGLALNVRYLRKADVSTTGAATSVGLSQVVNAVSHVVLLIGFAAATGASAQHSLPIPGWAFLAVGAIAVLALALLAIPVARRWLVARLLPPLREALPRLLNLLTSPSKLLESVGGAIALNVCYIVALWASAHAFGTHAGLAQIAVVYLAGAAIGAAAPTPGGLGAVEVAMSTGLTAVGMASTAAVSAVLLFRLATFVLPVPLGWLSMHWLQRHNAL
jgi:uncharacterized membrane protein YbhN (UPF0104 family)